MERKNVEILRHCVLRKNSEVNMFLAQNEGNNHKSVIGTSPNSEGIGALCRICANTNNHLVPIFEGEGSQLGLITKIHKYLPIQVTENDGLPRQLCYQCTVTIIAFHDIAEGCLEAEQKLIQLQQGKKSQKNSEEQQAVVAVEKDETSKKCEEFEAEIQEKQMAIEVSDEKAGGISQETTSVNEETERLKVTREYIDLPRGEEISKQFLNSFTPDASKLNQCRATVPEVPKVFLQDLPLSPRKIPPEDTFSHKRKEETAMQKSTIKLPAEQKKKHQTSKLQQKRSTCQTHDEQKLFTCHVCGKQFGQTGSLYYHLKHVHAGVKDHACDICGRCFAMKTAMHDHRRIHTGERPYVCDTCGKTFKTKAALYIHSKIHLDQFPYKCSYCNKPFKFKQQMLGHETTHTGIKNHTCDTCGKSFGVKWDLTRHLRIHSAEKPFICDQCGVSFGQKRYLTSHKRFKHRSE